MDLHYLPTSDVSYDKLVELQRRLLVATEAGTIKWERRGEQFEWIAEHGEVVVGVRSFHVWDTSGRRLRHFRPETEELFAAISARQQDMAIKVLEGILADLDQMDGAAG